MLLHVVKKKVSVYVFLELRHITLPGLTTCNQLIINILSLLWFGSRYVLRSDLKQPLIVYYDSVLALRFYFNTVFYSIFLLS